MGVVLFWLRIFQEKFESIAPTKTVQNPKQVGLYSILRRKKE